MTLESDSVTLVGAGICCCCEETIKGLVSNSRGQTSAFHTRGEDLSVNYQNSEKTNVQAMPVLFEGSTTFQL